MKTRSAKNKGRRLQVFVQNTLREIYCNETTELIEEDIASNIMSENGVDVKLTPAAKKYIPMDIECKNVENLNIFTAMEQATANCKNNRIPVVIFSRNRFPEFICFPYNKIYVLNENVIHKEIKSGNIWLHVHKDTDSFSFTMKNNIYYIMNYKSFLKRFCSNPYKITVQQ
jgi:hypothetical protein